MTISELSEVTGVSIYTLRRHAKNVLGPDEIAKRQSGFSRSLSISDAWKLYLYCTLVALLQSADSAMYHLKNVPNISTNLWTVEKNGFALKIIKLKSLYDNFIHLTSP